MLAEVKATSSYGEDRLRIIDDNVDLTSGEDRCLAVDNAIVFDRLAPLDCAPPTFVFASGPIEIRGHTAIRGRCYLESAVRITVRDSAQLTDVVLHAPEIIIQGSSTFSGQAIADHDIRILDDAVTARSALIAVNVAGIAEPNGITIASRRTCSGTIAILTDDGNITVSSHQPKAALVLEEQSTWNGLLYSEFPVAIKGRFLGSVVAPLLVYDEPPTTYLNWVIDTQIDRQSLPVAATVPWELGADSPSERVLYDPVGSDNVTLEIYSALSVRN
jgi:hypothetical protein